MDNLIRVIRNGATVRNVQQIAAMGAAMRKLVIIGLLFTLAYASRGYSAEVVIDPSAPDRYVVVPGDTLLGIAGRFMRDPWRWPQLFQLNRDQIKNPHRIYPGDVIVLDRSTGRARVVSGQEIRVSPRIRIEPREAEAVPSIPAAAIEPF